MSAELRDHRIPPRALLQPRVPVSAMLAIAAVVLVLVAWSVLSPSPRPVPQPSGEVTRQVPAQRVALPVPQQDESSVTLAPPQTIERPVLEDRYPVVDPMAEEQRRRDVESLRADNVVVRRADPVPVPSPVAPQTPAVQPVRQVDGITLPEGTVIEAVLTNRLDGSNEGPVNAMVTVDVYSGTTRVIPKGARVLGTASRVTDQHAERLAVSFHRLLFQDGRSVDLEQVPGLDQQGAVGVKDKVNRHYASTFGAAAAVGLLSGLGQWIGGGYRRDGGTVVVAGTTDAVTQAAMTTMNHFLNRLPTVTIREGHRLRVYLTKDIQVPR